MSVGRSCWSLLLLAFARQQRVLENIKQVVGMLGNGSFLNSPWNTQVDDMRPPVSRQRRYCFTWNNYPLDAEEQLRSLAERKRIVVPREAVSALSSDDDVYAEYTSLLFADGGDMSLTASIRHIILFSKVELALRTSTKIRKMILQVIENLKIAHCTLCMCYTHCTFVMCNPKHCTAHSYCG